MSTRAGRGLVFLGAKRTAFGTYGGALKDVNPTDLCLPATEAALAQAGVRAHDVDHVILGNVLHSAVDSIYTPRHVGLRAGVPVAVPALGINRLCGSGFQVVVEAAQQLAVGDSQIALVGGVENMSLSPYVLRGVRGGLRMGNAPISDMMTDSLFDTYAGAPMAITAENLAVDYQITREQADAFALKSQARTRDAEGAGRFAQERVAVKIRDRKGVETAFERDEHARPDTTPEVLAKLKPVFKKDGVVTAGNASGIVDGAAMLVVAAESVAQERGLKPLGRLVSYGIQGCDPSRMGIGPVPAIKQALQRAGMTLGQMDLVEVNEAFAPQTLAVQRELGIADEVLNVDGGAIAIGHPLAASGTRIVAHLLYELKRRGKRWGIGSACIGGGQGIALVVEIF